MTTEAPSAPFDLAHDTIQSFGHLLEERSRVFQRRRDLESFTARVAELDTKGEAGRRKGLGLWMIGRYAEAAEALAAHEDDDVAAFTRANALMSDRRPAEAKPIFERLSKKYPEEAKPRGGALTAQLEADLAEGDAEKAAERVIEALDAAPDSFHGSAEFHYLSGRAAEIERDLQSALDHYLAAREADPTHRGNLFHLARLAENRGLDELALEAYETLVSMLPIDAPVLMNLGILYEDLGRDQDAAACYDTVLRTMPVSPRARLFLEDARAGIDMYYDEDMEKKEDRLNQVLRTPITDFELSVRARNCLNKMNINTLGDLVKRTEAELLSFKNFGETSLSEIKEILGSKGLRLGMDRKEAVASIAKARALPAGDSSDPAHRPVSELQLSIRARRAVENLGCLTLGDITAHSEDELLGMPNFGVTSLAELKNKLSEYGLKLKSNKA